ncbi:unnamed protein product [Cylicocyclus nassatus]|uniref:SCP domain-containing protein n=1 Tax=Cylicocyclus nassatus TaxID=53992 RepID=A0AA36M1R8_CYLNA|nr:unnamed protein product [Cylicocyclus nassatus]
MASVGCVALLVFTIIANAAQTSQTEVCTPKKGMTDIIRNITLELHNSYRSDLALGKVKKHDGSILPQAGAMMQMHYLCELEDIAYNEVSNCPTSEIPREVVGPLEEENFAMIQKTNASNAKNAIKKAIRKWWSAVQTDPTPYDRQFHVMDRHTNSPLMSFIRMAWHETWGIGCGVKKCGDHYTIICRYRWGITLNTPLYWQGAPCSECWDPDTCNPSIGLCIE